MIDIEFFDEFEDNVDREYIRNALGSTQQLQEFLKKDEEEKKEKGDF